VSKEDDHILQGERKKEKRKKNHIIKFKILKKKGKKKACSIA
jgi:hypothetical protein